MGVVIDLTQPRTIKRLVFAAKILDEAFTYAKNLKRISSPNHPCTLAVSGFSGANSNLRMVFGCGFLCRILFVEKPSGNSSPLWENHTYSVIRLAPVEIPSIHVPRARDRVKLYLPYSYGIEASISHCIFTLLRCFTIYD